MRKIYDKNFVSAHYDPSILTFIIYDKSYKYKTINKIRWVDSTTQFMTLIEPQKSENKCQKNKIRVYLLSIKHKNLIDKITIPGNNYIKFLSNSGIYYI